MTIPEIMEILGDAQKIAAVPGGYGMVTLDDGTTVRMHNRDALIHGLLWQNLQQHHLPITKDHVYTVYPMKKDTISTALTVQYKDMLKAYPTADTFELVYTLWASIHRVYAFTYVHLGAYVRSLDLLDLIDVIHSPELRELTLAPLPADRGTAEAEREFKRRGDLVNKMLSTPGAVAHNPLLVFMQTGALKANQVPQLLCALGTRDDIDGAMLPHVMDCSGVSGMRTLADLGTESASPKKTTFYTKDVIPDTQSFNREMGLLTCNLKYAYKGDCGSRQLIWHTIAPKRGRCYLDKLVVHEGEIVPITKKNCHEYEGKRIQLISPVACKHVDGVCEHCAGRATTTPWAWIPDIRIGGYASSKIFSDISQLVLSAKHLIRTFTILLEMSAQASKYLILDVKQNLRLNRQLLKNLDDWALLVETGKVGHPNDLVVEGLSAIGFGKFNHVGFKHMRTGQVNAFNISNSEMVQHFSGKMLEHMREVRQDIRIDGRYYEIPLAGFNSRNAILDVQAKNDDMRAFANRVRTMFRSGISEFPNIELALDGITAEIHSKVEVNIFFIELVIKAILNSVLPEDGKISLERTRQAIATNNVAAKLGHAHVEDYLLSPDLTVPTKQPSPWDMLMGFID